ncbi:SpoIIE family protein phosphatase [Streptomyces sp. NPDC058865]
MSCLDGVAAVLHVRASADGPLRLSTSQGLSPETVRTWTLPAQDQDLAPVHAMRLGTFVWTDGEEIDGRLYGLASMPVPAGDGRTIGVLSVLTEGRGRPDALQRSLLGVVAAWLGAAVESADASPSPEGMSPRPDATVRIDDLTAALAEALTSRDVVDAVAHHVLRPFAADGLLVDLFMHGRPHLVHAVGYPEEFLRRIEELPLTANAVAIDVMTTRTPRFIGSAAEFARNYPTMQQELALSPMSAWAFLPLIASGHGIGLCTVSFSRPRSFTTEERTLLTALSSLVGQALERARLYDVEHARSQELQHGLLPAELPRLPAVCAAARYLPAALDEEVGGDWYDVIPLSADRVALVVGDVMGHGIAEAATMGRLRTAVRTLADLDMPPDELLSRLHDLVSDLGEDFYATCLYAVFDPVCRTLSYATAGHPPPVTVHPDGTVHHPELLPDPPLGAAEPPFALHDLPLPDRSLLALCTDGLIESTNRDADEGLDQLGRILAGAPYLGRTPARDDSQALEELCDLVTAGLLPNREQTSDDAALLVAQTYATAAADVAVCPLPDDPRAAGLARAYVRDRLSHWGLDELSMTTELLVSELVGNVVRHAQGPVRLRLLRSRTLICEVYDGSLSTPRIRHATHTDEGGRGLQLVAALAKSWGARFLHDGKCIWAEQDIPGGTVLGVS